MAIRHEASRREPSSVRAQAQGGRRIRGPILKKMIGKLEQRRIKGQSLSNAAKEVKQRLEEVFQERSYYEISASVRTLLGPSGQWVRKWGQLDWFLQKELNQLNPHGSYFLDPKDSMPYGLSFVALRILPNQDHKHQTRRWNPNSTGSGS